MNTIQKTITATVLKADNNSVTFSERMKNDDISVGSVISKRFSEIYPNESFKVEKIAIEITTRNETTGNETVLTRFYV